MSALLLSVNAGMLAFCWRAEEGSDLQAHLQFPALGLLAAVLAASSSILGGVPNSVQGKLNNLDHLVAWFAHFLCP